MGYRSEVKLILTDKGMEMLKAKVPQSLAEERPWEVDPIYEATKLQDRYWLLEWDAIKWYDEWLEYPVPYAVAELRRELHELKEPFQFMRIGDADEDIELDRVYSVHYRPYLALKREIEVEY